ncbi:MAG: hypothetical protein ACRC5R_02795 [Mycoplasmatales bacterium]
MKFYSVIVPDRKARTVAKTIQDIIFSNNLQIDSITSDNGIYSF